MEGEAAIQAWRGQDFVATSPCPPSPPLASRFEAGEMGRAWGRKKKKKKEDPPPLILSLWRRDPRSLGRNTDTKNL